MESRLETLKHIAEVSRLLNDVALNLIKRGELHDASKLESPEAEAFERETPVLRGVTYGTLEYRECLIRLGPALQHHYANNPHHPEAHEDGICGMSLLDLLEMCCDWMASSKRHADGDVRRSIQLNQGRFGYSNELKSILLNTVAELENPRRIESSDLQM